MENHTPTAVIPTARDFPRDTAGLPKGGVSEIVELADGDVYDVEIAPVAKQLGAATVRMLAYNGSIPGPTLKVRQGSEIDVRVANAGDLEATVHWHGIRVENQFDGTHETQAPMEVGDAFTYRLRFPDPGAYWYHPHIREDYGQELGLYGNILVVPSDPQYWAPANRELLVTLDDVLIEDGKIAPFDRGETNYVAMGRFGNVMLAGGEGHLKLDACRGEVVRFYLTNTANTRVFNVGFAGARMKLVGGDSGRCEREELVETVVLAPSERVVVDVLFEEPGRVTIAHHVPDRSYALGTVEVSEENAEPSFAAEFARLRANADLAEDRRRAAPYAGLEPDRTLAFVAEMDMGSADETGTYACPMHPEVVSANADDRCPQCGMKLVPAHMVGDAMDHGDHEHHEHHEHAPSDGIEWEDDMVEVNRMTTPANMRWKLVDRASGAENHAIDWRFRVGDRVKIRLVNEMDSDHPMHHPFHVHGAGRFLVLARDGVEEPNLVWKDTVLVRTGETVDILLDVTNPGIWMAHCHIAEHHESGMMFSFTVEEA